MSRNLRDFVNAVYTFDAVVRRTHADAWSSPSACDGWTGRDVVEHCIGVAGLVTTMAGGTPATSTGDPATDWTACRDALLTALDQPDCLQREGDTPFGRLTVDQLIGILGMDPVCHAYDLSVAAGVDPALDPALMERYQGQLEQAGDFARGEGMFGAPVEPPADATRTERFIAFTGRNPRP